MGGRMGEEQMGQRWGMVSPTGRKGHTPTRVFKQVDQASFFKKLLLVFGHVQLVKDKN